MKKEKKYEIFKANTIKELLLNTMNKVPDEIAFALKRDDKIVNITYKELKDDVINLASAIDKRGFENKKIMIIGKNSYEYCITYFALLFMGAIAVPIDAGLTEIEIENSINRAEPYAIFCDDKKIDIIKNKVKGNKNIEDRVFLLDILDGDIKKLIDEGKKIPEDEKNNILERKIDPEETKQILFTSGTTSAPKGVELTNKNITTNIIDMLTVIKVDHNDSSMAILPLHHTFGLTGVLVFMTVGAKISFPDSIKAIKKNLVEYKPTIIFAVPALLELVYQGIMHNIEKQKKMAIFKIMVGISNILRKCGIDIRRKLFKTILKELGGEWKLTFSGAAPISKNIIKGLDDIGIETMQGYGITECSPVISCENDTYRKVGSVGVALEHTQIKIDSPDENGIGEVIVKGENVFKGYYQDKEKTNEVKKDGWYYTGDLGKIEKGFLYITGRKKDMIVLNNGKKIFPEEIESLIKKIPYVKRSMVFGMPKNDDLMISVKIQYDEDIIKDTIKFNNKEELESKVFEDIKEINKLLPKYKYIKHLILTTEDFEMTTTLKIKRFIELEKIYKSLNIDKK